MFVLPCEAHTARPEKLKWKNWRVHSLTTRDELKVPVSLWPWTHRDPPPVFDGLARSSRQRELLDVACASQSSDFRIHGFVADTSQCVSRKPWGFQIPCMSQGSVIYSFELHRVLAAYDFVSLMGGPVEFPILETHPRDIQAMIGEAMFVPNLAGLLACTVFAGDMPWAPES